MRTLEAIFMKAFSISLCAALVLTGAICVPAFGGEKGRGRDAASAPDVEFAREGARRGIRPSGLTPGFPKDAGCPEIASGYASPTRYDGSARPATRFGGVHGGMDITLDEGTPLLAIASGKVIALGVGGQAEGIYVWLQHAPRDSGLPFWVYSKYQHLVALPGLKPGDILKAGDKLGLAGRTGTVGGHYGASGYSHLHLTTFAGSSDRYQQDGSRIVAEGARMIDPLTMFISGLGGIDDIEVLSDSQRNVAISHVGADGTIRPAGSRVVWPVACR